MVEKDAFIAMKKAITKAGNFFYQYRPCRRDAATIYDIENIQHDVVYARTPLSMNDPFDSQIGFSPDKIYDEAIGYIMQTFPDDINADSKKLLSFLLKYKLLNQFSDILSALSALKKYLRQQQNTAHKQNMSFELFVYQFAQNLYKNCPRHIKALFPFELYILFCRLITKLQDIEITEESLDEILNVSSLLEDFRGKIEQIRDEKYLPLFREFLSKLTVSCFSASGWKNPLMWSHYANSYSGICVEYDFSKMAEYIGFVKKVEYSAQRPTVSLKDLGISGLTVKDENGQKQYGLAQGDPDMDKILNYLLVKDTCWDYEKEWRIVNVEQKPFSPRFIKLPFVASITFGPNVDPLCRRLLLDICKEKKIECYDLSLSHEDFSIDRIKIDLDNLSFDEEGELRYLNLLLEEINESTNSTTTFAERFQENADQGIMDSISLIKALEKTLEFSCSIYFLKICFNRYCQNVDWATANISEIEIEQFKQSIQNLDRNFEINLEAIDGLEAAIETSRVKGTIFGIDYKKSIQIINDIKNISISYKSIEWANKGFKK